MLMVGGAGCWHSNSCSCVTQLLGACTSGPLIQAVECLIAYVLHTNFQLGKPPSVHIMVRQLKNSSVLERGLAQACKCLVFIYQEKIQNAQ